VDARGLLESKQTYGIEIVGPVQPDTSWQARTEEGLDVACFAIDWEAQQVTCPQGQQSVVWSASKDKYDNPVIHVRFAKQVCLDCSRRAQCTHSREGPRALKLQPKETHIALQEARQYQTTSEFKQRYAQRAGVEGTISQGTRGLGLRRSRYIGLAKTHLQHVCTAVAIDLMRLADWLADQPHHFIAGRANTPTVSLHRQVRPANEGGPTLQPPQSAFLPYQRDMLYSTTMKSRYRRFVAASRPSNPRAHAASSSANGGTGGSP